MWNDIVMTGADETDARALARLVGARIRRLRSERGWSLSSLAERAGLGKATLSELESGQRNPTLETLYAIAAQLQIGLSELLLEAGSPTDTAPVVRGDAVEGRLVAVYHDPTVTTEIYRLRIHPGRRQVSPGHGPGVVEHLLITAGAIHAGPLDRPVELSAGDDWTWEPREAHGYAAIGGEPAEAVLIMRHPARM
jgi:XRE family transcriptional regulator, regulator of sulfur utilization